jgi:hypothetical protein
MMSSENQNTQSQSQSQVSDLDGDAKSTYSSMTSPISVEASKQFKEACIECYFEFPDEHMIDTKNNFHYKIGSCQYCDTKVKWQCYPNKGKNNCYSHIISQHGKDYVDTVKEFEKLKKEALLASNKEDNNSNNHREKVQQTLRNHIQFASDKAKNIAAWMEWVIEDNLPFQFVEKSNSRKNSNLESISVNTLMKYIEGVSNEVVDAIKKEIETCDGKIGIGTDGCDDGNGTHYFGLFACYQIVEKESGKSIRKINLIAMSPPFDEEDYTAQSCATWITEQLIFYGNNKII